ncbi:MAG: tRNA-Thr(GGU) m(6)t(6)A37 methyltransferase TsaA [Flavobacteriales bacterium]|jgi:tRNA-Thr(GGU) m(6)t(6)A37 methyltransferase TsaA
MTFHFDEIARVHSCYKQKFGIPRQSGLSPSVRSTIEILPPYNRIEAFEDLKHSSHIWLQFVFHKNNRVTWKPKVKAPRLGGNRSASVFATRSPVRPNPIGLSVVVLEGIEKTSEGLFLTVSGADLMDGTPIIDIKPYVPYCDCLPEAENSFAAQAPVFFEVVIPDLVRKDLLATAIENFDVQIIETLRTNPAPQYQRGRQRDGQRKDGCESQEESAQVLRSYVVQLYNFDIHWCQRADDVIEVLKVLKLQ